MGDATHIVSAIEDDARRAAVKLLPLVDDELWGLAARRMTQEQPGRTLQGIRRL